MQLRGETCYEALTARDRRFDGLFFVGVKTTGIYCRPICTAKIPACRNCKFFRSAAQAELSGFRPCLRCRPELAPGTARVDASSRLAAAIASYIEDGALSQMSVAELAEKVGVSERHLRRVVKSEFGVSPLQLAQTQRLLLAKQLLTSADLPIADVAFASGFASLRRFNAIFKERYNLNPSALRNGKRKRLREEALTCELSYRVPFDWQAVVAFLSRRATRGVEAFINDTYVRTVKIEKTKGWISVRNAACQNMLEVRVSTSLIPILLSVLRKVRRLFDLNAEPERIAEHLGELAAKNPGLRVPGAFDSFETAVRGILGQQVSVKAATTLMGRFVEAFGESVKTPFAELSKVSPTAQTVAKLPPEDITRLGITLPRAKSIIALARAIVGGEICLDNSAELDKTLERLKDLPGIGDWTAQYLAMRALGWPDAFPHTDLGIRKALKQSSAKELMEISQAWRPWRSYAAMHIWKRLEEQS